MKRKRIILILIILIVLLAFFWPKETMRSGGLAGMSYGEDCNCIGWKYSYYPEGCADCFQTDYCAGIPYGCQKLGR